MLCNSFWLHARNHFLRQKNLRQNRVRWYLAYGLSLRDLEEMMAERGISVDQSTVHRWVIRFSRQLLEQVNKRERAVTG